jgi:hypothetical protein
VTRQLVLIACVVLGFSAGPALAFKNIEGCDIVAFAGKDSPVAIPAERWQAYRNSATAILAAAPVADAPIAQWRALANELVAAQETLLAPDHDSPAYRDYVAGESCRALSKLNAAAVDALLDEAAQTTSEPIGEALRRVTQAARTQIDNIERSARFRSLRDKTAMAAQYYCFVAGAVVALLPPERQQTVALDSFGTTIACRDVGRTG